MKQIIRWYLQDRISVTLAFVISDFLLIAFYSLTTKESIELAYPILLSIVVYLIFIGYDFYHYINVYHKINSLKSFQESNKQSHTCLDRYITDAMVGLHKQYQTKSFEQEEQTKERTRFLSAWVHNLKTPISVTRLLIERYEKGELEKEQVVLQLKEENDRTEQQLNIILEMIRMNEFVKDYSPQTVDLAEEIKSIINENKRLFIYSKIYPKIIKKQEEYLVLSDEKWNRTVINQLISNAVKYSEDGSAHHLYFILEHNTKTTTLSIRDEGMGIPKYDVPRVCEAFFTGENGRKGKRSSGIGLYFCKQVLSKLGHEFSIESTEGEGTTVTITYLTKLKG